MNPNNNRRNGKPASCEPCRLNKTKCDHSFPKCDRCIQRGIPERCFYHPAPLTKRRETEDDGEQHAGIEPPSIYRPRKRKRATKQTIEAALPISLSPQNDKFADAVAAEMSRPGYLGPTSYDAILPKDEASPLHDREESVGSDSSDRELTHQHPLTKSMRTQMATDVLKTLRYYPIILELINWYHDFCHAGVIPLPFDVSLVKALQPIVDRFNLTRSMPDPRLVNMVLQNSSRPLAISSTTKAHDFHEICSGDNIRFETIGFLLATAARALTFGSCSHLFTDPANPGQKSRLVDEMLRSSTSCIMLCNLISPVNDVMIWMLSENYSLTLQVCGFSGPPSWRRLGELVTQIYALGLHRESNTNNFPRWLLETRRRVFCSTYMQDKTISTFLGRPIRISKRHTDIKMPMDLSDAEIMSDEKTLDEAIQALDENGWNTKGAYLRASWARLRYISSTYREEIIDFTLVKLDENVERQLLDISRRITESWDSIPSHLRYWPTCWDEAISPSICLMLIVVHQTHWYNEFMIQKLLDQKQPLTSNTELLRVSTYLLSNTLTLGTIRDRSYDIHKDFIVQLILFGIPSASVLATALQEQQCTGQPFPPSISRAETIRMLSVLISHLDVTGHLDSSNTRPGEANYGLCRKACKAFTRIVDNVLDPKPRGEAEVTPTTTDVDLGLDLDMLTAPGLEAFEGMDFTTCDDEIDWGAMANWSL